MPAPDNTLRASQAPLVGDRLASQGFVLLPGPFVTAESALDAAWGACRRAARSSASARDWPALELVGEFVVPPRGERASRDFQALHFDFGLPLDPRQPQDAALYTALHIAADRGPVDAQTRLIRLGDLLRRRRWASREELVRRFRRYGASHGAWDPQIGYTEGILARLVEAAAEAEPVLPSVSATAGFLCGTEFASLEDEQRFFEGHGLSLAQAETTIDLRPGELLVFDNLASAHGRRGRRGPEELRQWIFGHRRLGASAQRVLRERILDAFELDSARE